MGQGCFKVRGSSSPVCGVHNVPLVRRQLPQELIASGIANVQVFCMSRERGSVARPVFALLEH
jgi:hypothetical protein